MTDQSVTIRGPIVGTITADGISTTGDIITNNGTVHASNVIATGTIQGGSITSTGNITANNGSVNASNVTAGSITSTGDITTFNSVKADTVRADGAIIADALVAQNQVVIGGRAVGQATLHAFNPPISIGSVRVFNSAVTRNSIILLTPLSDGRANFNAPPWVEGGQDGTFIIHGESERDVVIAYLIIN